jgi:hypothetical protein
MKDKLSQFESLCGLDTKGKYSQRPTDLDCGCGSSNFTFDDFEEQYVCENCGDVADDRAYTKPVIF